jgi:hypothetical protein
VHDGGDQDLRFLDDGQWRLKRIGNRLENYYWWSRMLFVQESIESRHEVVGRCGGDWKDTATAVDASDRQRRSRCPRLW